MTYYPVRSFHLPKLAAAILILIASGFPPVHAAAAENDGLVERLTDSVENRLRPALQPVNTPALQWTLEERMKKHRIPGVSIAIIRDDAVVWARGYGEIEAGSGVKVDTDTVFSIGSLSKIGAAMTALRLVDEDALNLDTNVVEYLDKWQPPTSNLAEGLPVTLRGLMSHTAGLGVHGFADFLPGEPTPATVQILNGTPPAKNAPVDFIYPPGSSSAYSGGGTTVTQLVIEETTGLPFQKATQELLFEPLGMARSTYENPLPATHGNIARAHDTDGSVTALPRGWHTFPETAASGLWTTPTDYARLVIALAKSYKGGTETFLSQGLAIDVLTEVGGSPYGLGPRLAGSGLERMFGHTGANEAYKAVFEYYPERGEGVVIFTNGANGSSLRREILFAVADTLGWPNHRQRRTIDTDKVLQSLDDFAGEYVAISDPSNASAQRAVFSRPRRYIISRKTDSISLGSAQLIDGGGSIVRKESVLPIAPSTFVTEDGETFIEFISDAFGRVTGFALKRAGNVAVFSRSEDASVPQE
ncbi:MAG: serine hydrolase domain-containing protein [Pseudomonadota bacterium]